MPRTPAQARAAKRFYGMAAFGVVLIIVGIVTILVPVMFFGVLVLTADVIIYANFIVKTRQARARQ
jgi:hypothetical protein